MPRDTGSHPETVARPGGIRDGGEARGADGRGSRQLFGKAVPVSVSTPR